MDRSELQLGDIIHFSTRTASCHDSNRWMVVTISTDTFLCLDAMHDDHRYGCTEEPTNGRGDLIIRRWT